ncbi:MAG: amidohydrolase [Kiritimatiellae bacterium]|nr:amidohydrolase [Kiritimatiellia bacterium]
MLFKNATLITMNPQRHIITHAALLTNGNRIADIGKTDEMTTRYPDEPVIDCNGNILMPGLIDTHVHTAQAMIRGCADDLSLIDWLFKRVWVMQGNYSTDDGRASAALCALEMIKSGTTGFIECMLAERYGFDGVAQIVEQSGLRAAIGKIVMDKPAYAQSELTMYPGMVESDGQACIENTLKMYDRWNGAAEGRIQVWFGARTPGGVTPSLFDEMAQLAKERNMGMTVHNSEVKQDLEYARSVGCRSALDFLLRHNYLGPRTVLAHCVWTDEEDWRVMQQTGTHVSHNPASNSKTAAGIAPIQGMLDAGVNVAMGCDGGPSNNTYDMIRDMRMVSYLASLKQNDPTVLPAETVLEMATLNGAKAMGIDHLCGSLEIGKRADFILINMDAPHLTPVWDPVSAIAYSAHGSDVDTVVIDGKIVMRNRKVLTLDEGAILEEARIRYRQVAARAGLEIKPRWPVL